MYHRLATALLALLLTGSAPSVPCPPQAERQSLEDLRRQAEEARALSREALGPEVARLVSDLEELKVTTRTSRTAAVQRALRELGPAAAPLLVRFLQPATMKGFEPTRGDVFRAELMAEVVAELASPAVTDELIRMATEGSPLARLNALTALAGTPEPERVTGPLMAIAGGRASIGASPELGSAIQQAAFMTLAVLGTPAGLEFIKGKVADSDPRVAAAALAGLGAAPVETSAAVVLQLLQTPAAPGLAGELFAYYDSHSELMDELDHSRGLGAVAVNPETASEARVDLFDLLRTTDARVGTPVKRKIDDYTNFARSDVRTAALMLLARMKDRSARKALLAEIGEPTGEQAFYIVQHASERARLLHEIGDYSASVKDWRRAFDASKGSSRNRKELFIGIAQTLARQKKYREAKQYLEDAPISLKELQSLSTRRDFRGMLATRYRDAFHLDD
jgi:tetratricopeptide (TPR) repeat protein